MWSNTEQLITKESLVRYPFLGRMRELSFCRAGGQQKVQAGLVHVFIKVLVFRPLPPHILTALVFRCTVQQEESTYNSSRGCSVYGNRLQSSAVQCTAKR